jgi:hypothetical protein
VSDNSSTSAHAHLTGAKVSFTPDIQAELGLDWKDGHLAPALDTEQGVGIHVCNPETGAVTAAVTLAAMTLHPDTVKLIVSSGELVAHTMAGAKEMLERMRT